MVRKTVTETMPATKEGCITSRHRASRNGDDKQESSPLQSHKAYSAENGHSVQSRQSA
jgi:hypothetical protein